MVVPVPPRLKTWNVSALLMFRLPLLILTDPGPVTVAPLMLNTPFANVMLDDGPGDRSIVPPIDCVAFAASRMEALSIMDCRVPLLLSGTLMMVVPTFDFLIVCPAALMIWPRPSELLIAVLF